MTKYRLIRGGMPEKYKLSPEDRLIVAEIDRRSEELLSFNYGTPTMNLPYKHFNDEAVALADASLAEVICDRYWRLQPALSERVRRSQHEDMPRNFPGGQLGFTLFNPNSPIIHPLEYRAILTSTDDELRRILPISVTFQDIGDPIRAKFESEDLGVYFKAVTILGQPYTLGVNEAQMSVAVMDDVNAPGELVRHPFLWNSMFWLEHDDAVLFFEFMNRALALQFADVPFAEMISEVRLIDRILYKTWLSHGPLVDFDFQVGFLNRLKEVKDTKRGGWGIFKGTGPIATSLLNTWITGGLSTGQQAALSAVRKQAQQTLFSTLMEDQAVEGEAAYIAVHLIAGRGLVTEFAQAIAESPFRDAAYGLFNHIKYGEPSEQLEHIGAVSRLIEVANEFLEGNVQMALAITNAGLRIWPEDAYLWRQRGIVNLALKQYGCAYRDLCWAYRLSDKLPDMDNIFEKTRQCVKDIELNIV